MNSIKCCRCYNIISTDKSKVLFSLKEKIIDKILCDDCTCNSFNSEETVDWYINLVKNYKNNEGV